MKAASCLDWNRSENLVLDFRPTRRYPVDIPTNQTVLDVFNEHQGGKDGNIIQLMISYTDQAFRLAVSWEKV
ncbi:hypothetical protein ACQ4M3_18390 [Leptolyngbya sp. AN03gr2]|uniref:hypothetical protein n=1 Tax=unclassified Leptolyngbya TaxID=2650499 RepID=UPI003D3115AC